MNNNPFITKEMSDRHTTQDMILFCEYCYDALTDLVKKDKFSPIPLGADKSAASSSFFSSLADEATITYAVHNLLESSLRSQYAQHASQTQRDNLSHKRAMLKIAFSDYYLNRNDTASLSDLNKNIAANQADISTATRDLIFAPISVIGSMVSGNPNELLQKGSAAWGNAMTGRAVAGFRKTARTDDPGEKADVFGSQMTGLALNVLGNLLSAKYSIPLTVVCACKSFLNRMDLKNENEMLKRIRQEVLSMPQSYESTTKIKEVHSSLLADIAKMNMA